MSKLLINEEPLQVLPGLAAAVGLNEAIVLQQLHYWLRRSDNLKNGHAWVYNTYEEWAEQFPFWSKVTVRRVFKSLEEKGLVIAGEFNRHSGDRTKWYRIDYEALPNGELTPSDQSDQTPTPHVINSITPSDQFDHLQSRSKRSPHIPETTRDYSRERARAEKSDPVEVFEEYLPYIRLTVLQKHEIDKLITDLDAWKRACQFWRRGNHHNVALLMDKYQEILDERSTEWKPKLNLYVPEELKAAAAQ